jgi:mRNA-decapping enzyme subunit 2
MPRPIENVWKYPRPPALQRCTSRLRVVWHSPHGETTTIADTTGAYRVLETSHPPTYYLPPSDVRMELLKTSAARRTMCEWKGLATYHDLTLPGASESASASAPVAKARIWSYPKPTPSFESIADYLSFYATSQSDKTAVGEWKCYVDDDEVCILDSGIFRMPF